MTGGRVRAFEVHVGDGPARQACLDGVRQFREGLELVGAPGWDAWVARPHGTFFVEGVAAGCVLTGVSVPPLPPALEVLARLGAGIGLAIARTQGDGALPTEVWAANGYGFGCVLLRPDAVLARGVGDLGSPSLNEAALEGLGRALWYVEAGHPGRIARLARARGASVWRGIGAASAFTGGLDEAGRAELTERAGIHADAFGAGASTGGLARTAALRVGRDAPSPQARIGGA